jgi:hypothetical protein
VDPKETLEEGECTHSLSWDLKRSGLVGDIGESERSEVG